MIQSKADLIEYMKMDRYALGKTRKHPLPIGDEIWRFEIYLRKHEYYLNTKKSKLLLYYYTIRHHLLGIRLGFSVPCNVFGGGLRINHHGYLVVNGKAKIGNFCDIHQGVNIGESTDSLAPHMGDDVWIGPGAKIFGGITLGSDLMIGANAVVNKSFYENGITLAGVPAKKISQKGNYHKRCQRYNEMSK